MLVLLVCFILKEGLKVAGISAHELSLDDSLKFVMNDIKAEGTDEECKRILYEKIRKIKYH